ncbi:MAG: hemerythrin domain-containing protein [Crocinitomicaceae bacterium]|nr:hemerythrin domain-containing protein [Crocinitomicaceae bacterium]
MNNPLYQFFTNDHRRIEKILEKAIADINNIKDEYYQEFRAGLLTHIKMEEKILFLEAQKANNNTPLPLAGELRLEHGAITSLMVPSPTADLIKVLKYVLEAHDLKEEKEGGMYEACESLTTNQTEELLEQLKNVTLTPIHPHNDAPIALEAAKRALLRAGFDYDKIVAEN